MNTDKILKNAAIPGVIALALLALSFRIPFKADDLIVGFGSVAVLAAIAALEYRINWRELIKR